jgi:hypothetical protein
MRKSLPDSPGQVTYRKLIPGLLPGLGLRGAGVVSSFALAWLVAWICGGEPEVSLFLLVLALTVLLQALPKLGNALLRTLGKVLLSQSCRQIFGLATVASMNQARWSIGVCPMAAVSRAIRLDQSADPVSQVFSRKSFRSFRRGAR